jgi:hypothetical protein
MRRSTDRRRPRLWLRPAEIAEETGFQGVRFYPSARPKTTSKKDIIEELKIRFRLAFRQYEEVKRYAERELRVRDIVQQRIYEHDGEEKSNDRKRLKVMHPGFDDDNHTQVIRNDPHPDAAEA